MHLLNLASKDLREHGVALGTMALGLCLAVYLIIKSSQLGSFSISSLEAVRKSLILLLPLITFILGNRLIVREYLGKTRLFVEALPTKRYKPLLQKYFFGLVYLLLLATAVVALSTLSSTFIDNVDSRRFYLILIKTLAIVFLYWSVVFCFSFCGFIRTILYLLLFGAIFLVNGIPNFDETAIGPFALLDEQLFTYERADFPWHDLAETAALGILFTVIGFAIALYNEGSLTEALSKPLSRRDFVATGILGFTLFVLLSSLYESWDKAPYNFGSGSIRHDDLPVSVFHIDDTYKEEGERMLEAIALAAKQLKTDYNIKRLPEIRLALDDTLEPHDFALDDIDGILITANYLDYDEYQIGVLQAAVFHQYFTRVTAQRVYYEPYHWFLDGVARWWTVHRVQDASDEHKQELLTRAVYASSLLKGTGELDLANHWQWLADKVGYPSAEAIAYSAILYLQNRYGENSLDALIDEILWHNYETGSGESWNEFLDPFEKRFARVVGVSWEVFLEEWQGFLGKTAQQPPYSNTLAKLPKFNTSISVELDAGGQRWILANYQPESDNLDFIGECVLRHAGLGPFDTEYVALIEDFNRVDCNAGELEHRVSSWYPEGSRVYVILEHESPLFHEPLRLDATRKTSP